MPDLRVSFPKPCSEKWENMTPVGCDRVCARCDKVIHDLSRRTIEEVEALVGADIETCVQARVDALGVVMLAPGRSMRRMVLAAGAAASSVKGIPGRHCRQDLDNRLAHPAHGHQWRREIVSRPGQATVDTG